MMDTTVAYLLLIVTLGAFGYVGFSSSGRADLDPDAYLSARGTQSWNRIGLSLFASGMGAWVLLTPSEVAYYGGFWDVMGYAISASTPFLLLAYVGPMIRDRLPDGVTLADYARERLGRRMQVYVGAISILYMFTFLFAEFTAIGKVMEELVGVEPIVPMVLVGVVTAAYTSYGGLPASLGTDRAQAFAILLLVTALLAFLFGADLGQLIADSKAYNTDDDWSIGSMSYTGSFQSGLALVVAITAAEMFSQGNWQRAWASKDDEALKLGALFAAALAFPLVFVMGFLGTVAAGQGGVEDASVAFFHLVGESGTLIVAAFVVLVVSLVCSSTDTLQNAIVASVSRDISEGKMGLRNARIFTVSMIPLAIYLATGPTLLGFTFDSLSVFGIFLFADLLAAATVAPVLLTLWDRVSSRGALLGCLAGIASVVAYGIVEPPSGYEGFSQHFRYLLHPTDGSIPASEGGLTNLWPFVSAILGSTVVTVSGSYALPDE
jgi:Na+/proline symporter